MSALFRVSPGCSQGIRETCSHLEPSVLFQAHVVSRILFLCCKTEASVFFLPAYWVSLSAPSKHPQVLGMVLSQHGSLLLQSEENAFPVDKMRSYNVKSSQKGQPHHIHRSCPCPRGQESWGHLRTRLTPRRD